MTDPTRRFSGRVGDYAKYRPGYPVEMLDLIAHLCRPDRGAGVADVGSGTGIFAELLLKRGFVVFGVEPNCEMRAAADSRLAGYVGFHSVDGTAEATTLEDNCVDLVTAAQSFHWFDPNHARREFARITRPKGLLVIVWNERRVDSSPFLVDYEGLLREYGTDYGRVDHTKTPEGNIVKMFDGKGYRTRSFYSEQALDHEGLLGRILSASYMPAPKHSRYEPMVDAVADLFRTHERKGSVTIEYDTVAYYGRPCRP